MSKIKVIVQSFSGTAMGGGFFWYLDTPEDREIALRSAQRDALDYGNVVVTAFTLKVPGDALPSDITELLDAELVFENGRAGEILYKRFTEPVGALK